MTAVEHLSALVPAPTTTAAAGGWHRPLVVTAAVGAGVAGGVLFAFSAFVMPALRALPANQGLAAMQSINKTAVTPLFMLELFGTAALCLGLGISALRHLDQPGRPLELAGAICYLGAIAVTAAFHVPRNDALALLDPNAPGSAAEWTRYAAAWTAGNHVRAALAIAGSVTLAQGLRR